MIRPLGEPLLRCAPTEALRAAARRRVDEGTTSPATRSASSRASKASKVGARKVPPAPASRTRPVKTTTTKKMSPPGRVARKTAANATKRAPPKAKGQTAPKKAPANAARPRAERLDARLQRPARGVRIEAPPAKRQAHAPSEPRCLAPDLAFGASPAEVLTTVPEPEAMGAPAPKEVLALLASAPAPLSRLVEHWPTVGAGEIAHVVHALVGTGLVCVDPTRRAGQTAYRATDAGLEALATVATEANTAPASAIVQQRPQAADDASHRGAEPASVARIGCATEGARETLCRTLVDALDRWYAAVARIGCATEGERAILRGTLVEALGRGHATASTVTHALPVAGAGPADDVGEACAVTLERKDTGDRDVPAPPYRSDPRAREDHGAEVHGDPRRPRPDGASAEDPSRQASAGEPSVPGKAVSWAPAEGVVLMITPLPAPGTDGGAEGAQPEVAPPTALVPDSRPPVDARAPNLELLPIAEAVESELVTVAPSDIDGALAGLPPEARANCTELDRISGLYEEAATAANTVRSYQSRFRLFVRWCRPRGVRAVPAHPEVVRLYLMGLASDHRARSTIEVAWAAISMAHRMLSHQVPVSERLRVALRGLRKTYYPSTTPVAIGLTMLRQIVEPCGEDLFGVRDRALLLLTYFRGLLRCETAGLDRERTTRETDGFILWLRQSNGDHEGKGKPVYVALQPDPLLCPVRALDRWLAVRGEHLRGAEVTAVRGPVFLSIHRSQGKGVDTQTLQERRLAPEDVYRIVRRRAESAGFAVGTVSAHGLRVGVYTEAARHGTTRNDIGDPARHAEVKTLPAHDGKATLGAQSGRRR